MVPTTGKEARQLGMLRYFTGIVCKRGHLSERYAADGHCVACDNQRNKPDEQRKKAINNYYVNHKDKCISASFKWRQASGKSYEYTKRARAKNPSLVSVVVIPDFSSKLTIVVAVP